MFNKLFNRKKEDPKPNSRTVRDLDLGYIFEYDLSTWEVKEVYEYDWGHEDFSKEFKINNGEKSYYLSVDEADELEISISSKLKLRKLSVDFDARVDGRFKAPRQIVFENKTYHLEGESPGYFKNAADKDVDENWEEFIAWDYYNDEETHCLTLEQWGENSFEASHGKLIKEFEISNILPRNKG